MTRILGVVVVLVGAEALACSCRPILDVFPPAESSVPTNVIFQVTLNASSPPRFQLFLDDQGVPLETTERPGTNWVTLKPVNELTPGGKYVLRSEDGSFSGNFFVMGGRDDSAPAARTLKKTSRNFVASGSSCGNTESIQLDVSEPLETGTALLVFTGESTSSQSLQGEASTFISQVELLSQSGCNTNLPLQSLPNLAVGVRVVDFAGNVSELSEVKQAKSAGCTAAPALLGILGALAMLLRRRSPSP
ncbi:MAG: hypothetical protein QM817_37830 [Archangium sp.]